mmetsp:Transcript_53963/g.151671  ORF Transcript_53963/g.151671 Transcript_53963/m.151671 type:complete len:244 (+) Transcript_53963:581-1312(+)
MTPCLIKYTKKCMAAMHQRNLFPNSTCIVDCFSPDSSAGALGFASSPPSASSSGSGSPPRARRAWWASAVGRPIFSGESRMRGRQSAPMAMAMRPGTRMPQRQPKVAATRPAISGMRKPPILLDAFQPLHHLPRVTVGNQFTSNFPHGEPPQPWKRPLATQKNVNQGTELPKDKPMLHRPVSIMPSEKIIEGEPRRSERTPAMNFEFMYARGKIELTAPNCSMLRPKLCLMAGPTKEKDKRVQ